MAEQKPEWCGRPNWYGRAVQAARIDGYTTHPPTLASLSCFLAERAGIVAPMSNTSRRRLIREYVGRLDSPIRDLPDPLERIILKALGSGS